MLTSRMDDKNRIDLPAEVLAALGVNPGGRLVWEFVDGKVIVRDPKPGDSTRSRS